MAPPLRREDYTVGWICALPVELAAAQEMLDEEHHDFERNPATNNDNLYALGSIGGHNVVIACLPAGRIGNNPAAAVATQMRATFKKIRFGLMVGIGGGVPSAEADIRLRDVVFNQPHKSFSGIVQYDVGKATPSGFERTGLLNSLKALHRNPVTAMRLLSRSDTGDFSLFQFGEEAIPLYAILPHTWGADTEQVTFEYLTNGTGKDKPGYKKIRFCGKQASRDGLQFLWIDTCCTNKENQAELSLAITSMFRWYRNANRCYVYLSDVSTTKRNVSIQFTWEPAFQETRWFTRGWILQEFLAPHSVAFFSQKVDHLETMLKLEHLLPAVSTREGSVGLQDEIRLSEDTFMRGLEIKLQTMKREFDVFFVAIRGRGRELTYEDNIKKRQYARGLRQEEKHGLVCDGIIALGRDATNCDEISADFELGCQYIWIDALCTVQDPSPINIQSSPAINVQDSSGSEEQCVVESDITCSTAPSDNTSLVSKPSENDPAAGMEISYHYNSSPSISQSLQENPLLRMGQILPANGHESELQDNRPLAPGFEDSHLSAGGREDSCYGDQELPHLGKDTAHLEEAILANYEASALRDFVDNPGHQYWTWCKEHQNWWHKDEKTNAMIWAPLDFD
jgi:hypothetical protein